MTTFGQLTRLRDDLAQISPHWATPCAPGPHSPAASAGLSPPTSPRPRPPVHGASPALIVQSTHQALAPHSAGFAMAAQLPGSDVLSREGDNYSMLLLSQCLRDATNPYLTTRTLPAPGTTGTE